MAYDVIIIGAGHNGLVTGFYLAKAGLRTLILERRPIVGGAVVTEEICPGYRCSTLAHIAQALRRDVARDLALERRGAIGIRPSVRVVAPAPDGRAILLCDDPERTAQALASRSAHDAAGYRAFSETMEAVRPVVAELLAMSPPPVDRLETRDLWNLLRLGRRFRGLQKQNAYALLRWATMPVADLVSEYFEDDLLRATIAAPGIIGAFAGPWSAGTGATFLIESAADESPPLVRGGLGALTDAMAVAAREAGADIRTGVEVARILVCDGLASGVALSDGDEIRAPTVVSNADPRRTFLGLIDPADLDPGFLVKIRGYRSDGAAAKVNLALDALPDFRGLERLATNGQRDALSGEVHIGPGIDYLERAFDAAKYGEISPEPYLNVTIPSIADPSLAPPGKHVMSIYMQFAPYRLRNGDWQSRRGELADRVIATLAQYAPRLPELIVERQIITPLDLEQAYGLTGGHIFHGEPSLDQLFAMRPLLGWAQYRTPIRGLYLCGAGTHPGGGVTGGPGRLASQQILRDRRRRR